MEAEEERGEEAQGEEGLPAAVKVEGEDMRDRDLNSRTANIPTVEAEEVPKEEKRLRTRTRKQGGRLENKPDTSMQWRQRKGEEKRLRERRVYLLQSKLRGKI